MRAAGDTAVAVLSRRQLRRREVSSIVSRLEDVLSAEERYRDNIPENLQGSVRFDDACAAIDMLEEAIDLLGDAY